MARPSKTAVAAPARLREAFWAALEQTPYAQLTVRELVGRAGLNRNSFYYHYANVTELAEDALRVLRPHELAARVLANPHDTAAVLQAVKEFPEIAVRAHRLSLAVGPHGSGALPELVKQNAIKFWLELFEVPESALTGEDCQILRFTIGGFITLVADAPKTNNWIEINRIISVPFYLSIVDHASAILRAAHARAVGDGQPS
ncbi:TetR/AcrR family transcriptional regulator [Actinobaculum massiliense]|uniref:TetR/AcrR family transcriptional regulator n=1 Tax=Actinobaculum massiliense TaxID=202789 RepID=UPI00288A990E|nr:TetR/AcrR family transcriptional regulator [Actinobaculum massiliense]